MDFYLAYKAEYDHFSYSSCDTLARRSFSTVRSIVNGKACTTVQPEVLLELNKANICYMVIFNGFKLLQGVVITSAFIVMDFTTDFTHGVELIYAH